MIIETPRTQPPAHDLDRLHPPGLPDRAVCTCGRSIFPTIPAGTMEARRIDILLDAHRIHRADRKEAGK